MKTLDWSMRLPGRAKLIQRRTQVPKRSSDGDLLRQASGTTDWSTDSPIEDYIDQVTKPLIENSSKLAALSTSRYRVGLRQLVASCDTRGRIHTASLKDLDITMAIKFRVRENCLQEIAAMHGTESARQARTVLNTYVLQQLQRDGLIENNPLRGARIDLETGAKLHEGSRSGAIALSQEDYLAVIDYLLIADPAEGVVKSKLGRWDLQTRINKRAGAIEITLMQMATGRRVNEARQVRGWMLKDTGDSLSIDVAAAIAKRGIARHSHFLQPRIAERIRQRAAHAASPDSPLVGAPADPEKLWSYKSLTDCLGELYREMRQSLGIEAFDFERSHIWRATLNTMLVGVVPEVNRAAQFGHTTEVNRRSYTSNAMSDAMVKAGAAVLAKSV